MTPGRSMTPVDFEDLLDRHGGDLMLWPAASRDEANDLLAVSPAARGALKAMLEVEKGFVASRQPETSDGSMAARATRSRQNGLARRSAMRIGWSAIAVIVLMLGIRIGLSNGAHDEEPSRALSVALATTEVFDVD